jgi:ABC-type nitrate/sulfonate/bicarbonate transport system substrate-binding protein
MPRRTPLFALVPLLALAAACGGDDTPDAGNTTVPGSVAPTDAASVPETGTPAGSVPHLVGGAPIPPERCEANRAAGTITYLSGFDFAATASIVEVLVAEERGWFDELCLDVEVVASFSTANYPQIASNQAQFASAGSFSEVVEFGQNNDADLVAVAVEGKTGVDALIVKDGEAETLEDLRGETIGVKGAITRSVKAMLQQAGLVEGTDYETVLIDGFDPKVHVEIPAIVGFPGYKSNEPLQLEAAGIEFDLFDPAAYDVPGSFGVLYSNRTFLTEHPTAAQDFLRASMRGLDEAIADPAVAAEIAIGFINANGNAMFLSPEGETARWAVESTLVAESNTGATTYGLADVDLLTDEVTTYAGIGFFGGEVPDIAPFVDVDLIGGVYDDAGAVIWPSEG